MSIYTFEVKTNTGQLESLANFRGKVLLIVNVASKCGFTPQYEGLQTLHSTYNERGFAVLGFPCNQFGAQEPGSDQDIAAFCDLNYQVKFPLYAKIDVNGANADPLFKYLQQEAPGLLGTKAIKWNFTKFLINRSGQPVTRFAPTTEPLSLVSAIERELAENPRP